MSAGLVRPCRGLSCLTHGLLQAHKAAVAKLSSDVAQARSTVMMQQAVLCSLEKQLKESSATVLTLNQDLTSAQDAHNSAMQVLHCNCDCLES